MSIWENNNILVQASGTVREITEQEELNNMKNKVLQSLSHYKNFWWPIYDIEKGEYVSYKIHTDWMRVLDLSNSVEKGRERFFEIDIKD